MSKKNDNKANKKNCSRDSDSDEPTSKKAAKEPIIEAMPGALHHKRAKLLKIVGRRWCIFVSETEAQFEVSCLEEYQDPQDKTELLSRWRCPIELRHHHLKVITDRSPFIYWVFQERMQYSSKLYLEFCSFFRLKANIEECRRIQEQVEMESSGEEEKKEEERDEKEVVKKRKVLPSEDMSENEEESEESEHEEDGDETSTESNKSHESEGGSAEGEESDTERRECKRKTQLPANLDEWYEPVRIRPYRYAYRWFDGIEADEMGKLNRFSELPNKRPAKDSCGSCYRLYKSHLLDEVEEDYNPYRRATFSELPRTITSELVLDAANGMPPRIVDNECLMIYQLSEGDLVEREEAKAGKEFPPCCRWNNMLEFRKRVRRGLRIPDCTPRARSNSEYEEEANEEDELNEGDLISSRPSRENIHLSSRPTESDSDDEHGSPSTEEERNGHDEYEQTGSRRPSSPFERNSPPSEDHQGPPDESGSPQVGQHRDNPARHGSDEDDNADTRDFQSSSSSHHLSSSLRPATSPQLSSSPKAPSSLSVRLSADPPSATTSRRSSRSSPLPSSTDIRESVDYTEFTGYIGSYYPPRHHNSMSEDHHSSRHQPPPDASSSSSTAGHTDQNRKSQKEYSLKNHWHPSVNRQFAGPPAPGCSIAKKRDRIANPHTMPTPTVQPPLLLLPPAPPPPPPDKPPHHSTQQHFSSHPSHRYISPQNAVAPAPPRQPPFPLLPSPPPPAYPPQPAQPPASILQPVPPSTSRTHPPPSAPPAAPTEQSYSRIHRQQSDDDIQVVGGMVNGHVWHSRRRH